MGQAYIKRPYPKARHKFTWTPEADICLRQLSGVASEKVIAAAIGCSVAAVGNRKTALKRKDAESQGDTTKSARVARMVHLTERIGQCKTYLRTHPPLKSGHAS
jgi:hypothetical protein